MRYSVLVLGGYGNFGGKISAALAKSDGIEVIIAGRNKHKANTFAVDLNNRLGSKVRALVLDIQQDDLCEKLAESGAQLVIHTSGPFQQQDYHVAEACIVCGIHYIDLADGRDFVCGFEALDEKAKEKGVLAVTGASSVPGLSSAVINEFLPKFDELTEIEYGIAPGNKADRGEATVKSILSYTGRPINRWQDGNWQSVYGWQENHRHRFPEPVGKRWLANCDIPDLDLFPKQYPGLHTIKFYAGLELSSMHLGMWLMSWLARFRLIKNWARYARPITRMSCWFRGFGTDIGGMYMEFRGFDTNENFLNLRWDLVAVDGHGPQIPTIPSVILAKKLAKGELSLTGATACVGLFSLADFSAETRTWNIWQEVDDSPVLIE